MSGSMSARSRARQLIRSLSPTLWEHLRRLRRRLLDRRGSARVFADIYHRNSWGSAESISGPGSTSAETRWVRDALPALLVRLGVRSLVDAPCGDAGWIATVLPGDVAYTGIDIVPELIERNRREKAALGSFHVGDLTSDPLPRADLVLVRDCFIHLPNAMIRRALANVRASGATWLLTTTYTGVAHTDDIEIGGFRPLRLDGPPFDLPPPVELIAESDDGTSHHGKSLGLWRVADL